MSPSKKLLIGMSGSIAAFKVAHIISYFRKKNWEVRVITTPSTLEFIGAATLEGLSDNAVISSDFVHGKMMSHIELARWADVFLIAPATAKTINALACGVGDGILHSTYLAYSSAKPLLLAPAMNTQMLAHLTTQKSLTTLKNNGVQILQTGSGSLACGEVGDGRMMEPELIAAAVERSLVPTNTKLNVLITMGGTRVPIDSVRSITNTSSGATGAQLADDLFLQGYNVVVLASKTAHLPKLVTKVLLFDTYDDLETLLETTLQQSQFSHIIHMAAVSDFTTSTTVSKIPSGQNRELKLIPTKKLISRIKTLAPQSFVTGFKLTVHASHLDVDKAVHSVFKNGADAVIHNDLSKISSTLHQLTLHTSHGPVATVAQKSQLADLIINHLFNTTTNSLDLNEVLYDSLS